MDHVQSTYCGSGAQELVLDLSGRQLQNLLVETRGEGGCQAKEGGLPGLVGWGVSLLTGIVWPGGLQPGLSQKEELGYRRNLG